MVNNLNIDLKEIGFKNSTMGYKDKNVTTFKVEVGVEGMKKAILDIFFEGMNEDYNKYEGYFYLDEEGNPKFVIQIL